MKIDVDKNDLINMVKSTTPSFTYRRSDQISVLRDSADPYFWAWNLSKLKELSEEQLLSLYHACLNSWKP